MDLMESTLFAPPIILLQTVLEEVRHRSLPLYNRLKALAKSDEKRVWVFYNEYRSCVSPRYLFGKPFFKAVGKRPSCERKMKHRMTEMIEVLGSLHLGIRPICPNQGRVPALQVKANHLPLSY